MACGLRSQKYTKHPRAAKQSSPLPAGPCFAQRAEAASELSSVRAKLEEQQGHMQEVQQRVKLLEVRLKRGLAVWPCLRSMSWWDYGCGFGSGYPCHQALPAAHGPLAKPPLLVSCLCTGVMRALPLHEVILSWLVHPAARQRSAWLAADATVRGSGLLPAKAAI